ncbi:hypothetical protein TWF730_004470 [Orbilia blumenaviensis]|uniref:Uncharacterized protein n=1 Tax=Orbilia blumenaviensis TaxID=1796055 RepID=A0AAV9U2M1_9PEZI
MPRAYRSTLACIPEQTEECEWSCSASAQEARSSGTSCPNGRNSPLQNDDKGGSFEQGNQGLQLAGVFAGLSLGGVSSSGSNG